MAKRRPQYVVRIVVDDRTRPWFNNPFLECLRYAGIVKDAGIVEVRTDDHTHEYTVFDLYPPLYNTPDHKMWAEWNAERMRSFGINAEAIPT